MYNNLCKIVEMVNLCNTILYVLYLFMNFICLTKKEIKDEKETLWCDKESLLNCVMNEFILINMIYRCLSTICALFCPIHRKVAQVVPWLLLGKSRYLWIATSKLAEINGIQKPRLIYETDMFHSQLLLIYIKRGHFFIAQFFLWHPV